MIVQSQARQGGNNTIWTAIVSSPDLSSLCHEFKELFRSTPGTTTMMQHFIPTVGPSVKIPPRRVPANYRKAVDEQLHAMLEMGIIEKSSSILQVGSLVQLRRITM